MPKLYRVVCLLYSDTETEERVWSLTVLARNDHHARRLVLESALAMQSFVSRFVSVEKSVRRVER